jgi:iron complex outermembrane receptor protein
MNYRLMKTHMRVASGLVILALSSGAAMAQEGVEQVVVSSTRLQSAGFDAPTPTTVVSSADLQNLAQPNVFNALTQLPALQGSTGTTYNTGSTSTGLQGLSGLGLRGLSPLRTLVLVDGQRVVGGNFNGVVDVSQLPQMLIKRVDVVTGGASASWGSDAIAGVVNFVTDKKFEGFRANVMGGISTYGDDTNTLVQLAAGTSFLGGKAHIEGALEYSYDAGLQPGGKPSSSFGINPQIGGRNLGYGQNWSSSQLAIAKTPAGQPQITYGTHAQLWNNSGSAAPVAYGLITNGPLAGTAFGAGGSTYQFDYAGGGVAQSNGTVLGCAPNNCFGTQGDPGDQSNHNTGTSQSLVSPLTRGSLYTRASYDITPSIEIYGTLTLSASRTQVIPTNSTSKSNWNVSCNNAYLSAAIVAAAGCASPASTATAFQYTWANAQFPGYQTVNLQRDMRRYVVGADGVFNFMGKDWSFDTYFEHGENDASIHIRNQILNSRLTAATNAVVNGNGQIVCASTVAQAAGCVPYNIFGDVPITSGTWNYLINGGNGPVAVTNQRQEAFSASINGSPLANWAGDVSVALGVEYREEAYNQVADPYGNGVTASSPNSFAYPADPTFAGTSATDGNNWNAGNYHNGRGIYHVSEVFLETGVPLLNDPIWGKADLDLAGRFEAYSPSGDFSTWKVGLTYDTPVPGLRLRALQSRDVRAPNLSELFGPTSGLNGNVVNTFDPNASQINVRALNEGNPLLKPERSQTTEVGVVYQPEFLPGFQASVDYYRIMVKGVVGSLSTQQVVDQCFQGVASYCAQNLIQTANGLPISATNPPNQVASQLFNLGSLTTDGFDIEARYGFKLDDWNIPGDFQIRSLVNHTSKFITDPNIPGQIPVESAGAYGGSNGGSSNYNQSGGIVLTWKAQVTQTYQNDDWGVNLTERWFPNGVVNRNYILCTVSFCPPPTVNHPTTNFNKVDGAFYLDFGANYNINERTQIYGKIDNITNLMPPLGGGNVLFDVVGRMFRVGVRIQNN